MPLDNIKTRMHCLVKVSAIDVHNARSAVSSQQIVRDEGTLRLWGGSTPRLARLMVSICTLPVRYVVVKLMLSG
jgi:solute carrier family 25 citrate transporter 1